MLINEKNSGQTPISVLLKDPQKLPGTELVMGVTDLYQWSLDMNAFNDTLKSIQI